MTTSEFKVVHLTDDTWTVINTLHVKEMYPGKDPKGNAATVIVFVDEDVFYAKTSVEQLAVPNVQTPPSLAHAERSRPRVVSPNPESQAVAPLLPDQLKP
jgi:hypothetical protein